jgi:putative ABC transport system permease protein
MNAVAKLSLRSIAENRDRYVLGCVAVSVAAAFMVAARMVTDALSTQLRSAGVAETGTSSSSLFLLLSAFGLIVIIAAGFVIANSFQTMVSARVHELALLRTIGMRSRQTFYTVVIEALVLGSVGTVLGVLLGTLIGWTIIAATITGTALAAPSASALVLASMVGVGVTTAAVLSPAIRASRAAPVTTLSDAETIAGESLGWLRTTIGVAALTLGLLMAIAPLTEDNLAVFSFVFGALVCFAGLSLLGPTFIPPLARVMAPAFTRGLTRRLATENLTRSRRRTANTAMAIILGVALFTGVNVVLSSVVTQARAQGYSLDDFNEIFLLAFGLTGLTIVVGLIGVLNTVTLSIRERRREFALLRAVGMTSSEIQRTVTLEGFLVGFVGVTVGAVLGVIGAAVLLIRLGGAIGLSPPWSTLGVAALGTLGIIAIATRLLAAKASSCQPTLATS